MFTEVLLPLAALSLQALAAPAPQPEPVASPAPTPAPNASPELLQDLISPVPKSIASQLSAFTHQKSSIASQDIPAFFSAYAAIITDATVSSNTPTATAQLESVVEDIFKPIQTDASGAKSINIIVAAVELVTNGINPDYTNGIIGSVAGSIQSFNNVNKRNPSRTIYPKKQSGDAPYDVAESKLRAALYIPPGFTYGKKLPVVLMPGTGATGGSTFSGNQIPLLSNDDRFDLVYVNVPGYMLDDAQTNAEYAAYAINYISSITNRKVGVVSWSQGGMSVQWALKYWPSTRSAVQDFVAISPDFHGTVNAYFLCPWWPLMPCPYSILQQEYTSSFSAKLRENGGDSAYVPTTTIYSSIFDEIVEPQTGVGASGFLKNARNIGVTNNELQAICPVTPGGSFYTHELTLANPVTSALVVDALTHDGPGQINRLDLNSLCTLYLAPGLSVADGIATQALDVQAAINLLLYPGKSYVEPPIKSYAK